MYEAHLEIRSTSPILLNPATRELLATLEGSVKRPKSAKPTNEEKCEKIIKEFMELYGAIGLPASYITGNFVNAGKRVQFSGQTKMTASKKDTMLFSVMLVHMPESRFFVFDPCSQWEVDVAKGTNPNGGEAVVIARPRIDTWGFDLDITVHDDGIMPPEKLAELWHYAGTAYGYGDHRPQKGGNYGMFETKITCSDKTKERTSSVTLIDNTSKAETGSTPVDASSTEGELVGAGSSNGNGSHS